MCTPTFTMTIDSSRFSYHFSESLSEALCQRTLQTVRPFDQCLPSCVCPIRILSERACAWTSDKRMNTNIVSYAVASSHSLRPREKENSPATRVRLVQFFEVIFKTNVVCKFSVDNPRTSHLSDLSKLLLTNNELRSLPVYLRLHVFAPNTENLRIFRTYVCYSCAFTHERSMNIV